MARYYVYSVSDTETKACLVGSDEYIAVFQSPMFWEIGECDATSESEAVEKLIEWTTKNDAPKS